MVFPKMRTSILAAVLALPAAFLIGCGDNDDTTGPDEDPGDGMEAVTVQAASLGALDLVTSMTEDMSEWIDGPPSGRSDPFPWNDAEQRYQWVESIQFGQEPNVITREGSFWVQFRDASGKSTSIPCVSSGAVIIKIMSNTSMTSM